LVEGELMSNEIEFYFDFSSPYGYIAANRIEAIGQKHTREVIWKPFLLGAMFQINGQVPLKEQKFKWDYSSHDIARCARRYGLDWVLPEPFPIPTQAAGRAFFWVDDQDAIVAKNFALDVYREYFAGGKDIRSKELVAGIASSLGMDKKDCIAAIDDGVYKEKLKAVTSDAITRNICGSPFFFVDDEPFWGHDRLEMVDEWLSKSGW